MSSLVAVAYPHDDPAGTALGVLTELSDLKVTVEHDGVGAGELTINGNSSQASWTSPGNYIAIWRDTVAGDPIAGFWVNDAKDTLISEQEEGGQDWRRSGPGPIMCLDEVIVWHRRFLGGRLAQVRPRRGRWVFRGNDFPLVRVLTRMVREAKRRGGIPFVTFGFTDAVDSDGNPWPDDTRADRYSVPIGITLTELVTMLRAKGLRIEMDADFTLQAWPEERISVQDVVFTEGIDIREHVERDGRASRMKSAVLVGGERKRGGERYAAVGNSNIEDLLGRRKEGFADIGRVARPQVLKRVGRRRLRKWKALKDGPASVAVIDTPGQVALVDYRPGDMVGLTIPGAYEGCQVIEAITLVMTENGEYDPVIEFGGLIRVGGEDWSDDAATAVRG